MKKHSADNYNHNIPSLSNFQSSVNKRKNVNLKCVKSDPCVRNCSTLNENLSTSSNHDSVCNSKKDSIMLQQLFKPVISSSGTKKYERCNVFVVVNENLESELDVDKPKTVNKPTETDELNVCQKTDKHYSYNQTMKTSSSSNLTELQTIAAFVTKEISCDANQGITLCNSCAFSYSASSKNNSIVQGRSMESIEVINNHQYESSSSGVIDNFSSSSAEVLFTDLAHKPCAVDSKCDLSLPTSSVPTPSTVSTGKININYPEHSNASTFTSSSCSTDKILTVNNYAAEQTSAYERLFKKRNLQQCEVVRFSKERSEMSYEPSECGSTTSSVPSHSIQGSIWSDPERNCTWYDEHAAQKSALIKDPRRNKRVNWHALQANVRDLDNICLANFILRRETQVKKAQKKAIIIAKLLDVTCNTKCSGKNIK